jgi:hypothetical protein
MNVVKKMFVKKATIDACKSLGSARLRNVLRFKNAIDQDVVVRAWPKAAFRIKVEQIEAEFHLVVLDQAKTEVPPSIGEGMLQKTMGVLSNRADKDNASVENNQQGESKYVLAKFSNQEDAIAALNEVHGKLSRSGVKKLVKVAVMMGVFLLVVSFFFALFQTTQVQSNAAPTKVSGLPSQESLSNSSFPTRYNSGSVTTVGQPRQQAEEETQSTGGSTEINTAALKAMTEDALSGMGAQAASRQKELADKFNAENGLNVNGEKSQFAESADINSVFKNSR